MTDKTSPTPFAASAAEMKIIDEFPLPYMELDASGYITHANRATKDLHPSDQGELIGRFVWDSIPTDEKEKNCAAYFSIMESGEEPPVTHRSIYDSSGQFRTYKLFRTLLRNEEGRPVGMRMVCVDVSEAKKDLEEARRARLWLESVIASLTDAVIVTDALGFISSLNPAAEAMFGWKAEELTGKLIEKALPILSYVSCNKTKLVAPMALTSQCRGFATMLDHERREMCVEIGTSPILDQENGSAEGVVTVLRRLDKGA